MNASSLGGFVQRTVQGAAADDDFPTAEIHVLRSLGVEHHLQDGRHTVGERHLLLAPQLHQVFRVVAAGVHLLEPEHGRHIRQAPGVYVEHRRDRHVHVVGAQQPHAVDAAHDGRYANGVQHQLPMGEVHALGVAGGAGGVEGGGDRVFVEVLEVIGGAGGGQQGFVLTYQVGQLGGVGVTIGNQ